MKTLKIIFKWTIISLFSGLLSGTVGSLFSHSITFVTSFRGQNGWIIFFLPLGGILTVKIYRLLKTQGLGTNQVLATLTGKENVSPLLVPAVFSGAVLTHLLGGSAGREGAALQMGGGTASFVSKVFKLNKEETKIAAICGMSAFFSALFGTPLGAAFFGAEVVFQKRQSTKSILPAILSSLTAFIISQGLLTHAERFSLSIPRFTVSLIWEIMIIIILASAVCMLFVFCLHKTEEVFKGLLKNEYVRITVGGVILICLTLIVGTRDYNGGGMDIVENIFTHSQVKSESFLLKMLFTCVTVASGFKGGEIVPTFFIGATFGGALAALMGISAPFGAALGMAVLFSGATNCPLATVFLCGELFGFKGILYFLAASFFAFFLTGKKRLYTV